VTMWSADDNNRVRIWKSDGTVMKLMIKNPAFPKDRSKAEALTKEQFAVVHDYIVGCMNAGKVPSDKVVIAACAEAGMPLFVAQVEPWIEHEVVRAAAALRERAKLNSGDDQTHE
jgi:hypothetical protein